MWRRSSKVGSSFRILFVPAYRTSQTYNIKKQHSASPDRGHIHTAPGLQFPPKFPCLTAQQAHPHPPHTSKGMQPVMLAQFNFRTFHSTSQNSGIGADWEKSLRSCPGRPLPSRTHPAGYTYRPAPHRPAQKPKTTPLYTIITHQCFPFSLSAVPMIRFAPQNQSNTAAAWSPAAWRLHSHQSSLPA